MTRMMPREEKLGCVEPARDVRRETQTTGAALYTVHVRDMVARGTCIEAGITPRGKNMSRTHKATRHHTHASEHTTPSRTAGAGGEGGT